MWDEKSVYPKIESGFAFKSHMNDVFANDIINQTFNQDGNNSALLKKKILHPPSLIFQHLAVKEKVENVELNRRRKSHNIDTLTPVDIQEIVKMGGEVIRMYEAVIYQENLKVSPFRKILEKLFILRRKK